MSDIISSVSVILIFLTFLFNGIQRDISSKLNENKPNSIQKEARKSYNNQIREMLFLKVIPTTIIFGMVFYLMLPETIEILSISTLDLWAFDELSTLFFFIEVGLFGLFAFCLIRIWQIIVRLYE